MQNSVASSVPLAQAAPVRAMWGVFDRKERWSLSWRGRLIVASALLLVGALVLKGVYPFLAITHRVNANILVVEGWIHEYAIRAAVKEFRSNHYERVFTTGGPVVGTGGYINDFYTSASVGADLLKKWGLPDERLQMVPSRVMDRDRTYGSAVALRNWFRDHNMVVRSVNVMTEDMHARRTRLLFEEALGKSVTVGIIIQQTGGANRSGISLVLVLNNENSCCRSRLRRATAVASICSLVRECVGPGC